MPRSLTRQTQEVNPLTARAEPAAVFKELSVAPGLVFLDSCSGAFGNLAQWSFVAAYPDETLTLEGTELIRHSAEGVRLARVPAANPFAALKAFHGCGQDRKVELPEEVAGCSLLQGGVIGYMGYEIGHYVETLPAVGPPLAAHPQMWFGRYRNLLAYNHDTRRWWLAAGDENAAEFEAAVERAGDTGCDLPDAPVVECVTIDPGAGAYEAAVEVILNHIRAGDIYQANLVRQVTIDCREQIDPVALYLRLRQLNSAPFAAALRVGDGSSWVLSTSPERFLRVQGSAVEVRPIKGTAPRYRDLGQDRASAEALLGSEKDAAELAMIVDVLRNDIGRVCHYGSVQVSEHKALESYARVHHLVSTVRGSLYHQRDLFDLLAAAYPGGSITGAPKVKAMEILAGIEPAARGVSTGAIGYISNTLDADFSIAIRTVVTRRRGACFGVGGGIVADSGPEAERLETLHKASAIFDAFNIETPDL